MKPTLPEAIQALIETNLRELRISLPARIERYDAALQQIDAQPLIKESHTSETGDRVAAQLPVLCNVPIVFPGIGSYRITFPVAQGDTVLLVFSAASLDVWLSQDGLVDPLSDQKFSLVDAIAIPGLRSFKNPLSSADEDKMSIGHDDGSRIFIEEDAIRLNTEGGQLVALANKVDAAISTLRTFATTHIHGSVVGPTTIATTALGSNTLSACDGVYAKE